MPDISNLARTRLQRGELALGVALRFSRTVDVARTMKSAGYDWMFFDLEHGSMSLDIAAQISVASLDVGIASIMRVSQWDFATATRALDNGALGIIMPHVNTADEARLVVEKLKYPPIGHRSISSMVPQYSYAPVSMIELTETLNRETLVVVMIETPEAVENIDAIAEVPGLDALLVGTNDLCAEMGIPGDFGNAKVVAVYEKLVAACKRNGKWPGMAGVPQEAIMANYIKLGVKLIQGANDISLMRSAAVERCRFLRNLESAP